MKVKIENFSCPVEISDTYFEDLNTQIEKENVYLNNRFEPINIFDELMDFNDRNCEIRIIIDDYYAIRYFVNTYSTGLHDLQLFKIPDSQILLIGGKRKSLSLDLGSMQVANVYEHNLFWGFDTMNDYILEFGELNCLFRDKSGKILNSVDMEPPWECFREEDGLRFESDGLTGTTFLKFPTVNK